jgi:hypothetical protein
VDRSEVEDEAERRVDLPKFVKGEVSHLGAEPVGINCRCLLRQNPSRSTADFYLGSEAGRSS